MALDPGVVEMRALHDRARALVLPETLGAFIAERARTLGDRTACSYFSDDVTLSYREIDDTANRLATSFLGLGMRKGAHVAVMLPNVPALPATWTAIARTGAIMVPVNAGYTGPELSFVLNDSDAQFLILHEDLLDVFETMPDRPALISDSRVVVVGDTRGRYLSWDEMRAAGGSAFEPPTPVGPGDLLNLQYTSGTTGFPKGCLLTHQYWMLLSHTAALPYQDGGVENVLIWAPFYYMDPMWQMLMAFRLGGTAFITRRMSATRFMDWVRQFKIHYCAFPEPVLGRTEPSEADRATELRHVSTFGWRGEAIAELERRFGVIGRDAFGMTEIGVGSVMPKSAGHMIGTGSCGLPGPFREARIMNEAGHEVGVGEVGELWMAGPGILWGYYKRPQANADNFRGRWFRTGDLFRRDANGYLTIVGRLKDMIKRSGENISAREVEAVLRDMAEIEEAAVVAVPDPMRREEVKAYVLLGEGASPERVPPARILEHCAGRLAKFKIPRYIAYIDAFPRTPTQKIAKQRLIADRDDLRLGAYDRVDDVWR